MDFFLVAVSGELTALVDDCTPVADDQRCVELIETSVFTKQITALLTDEEYREFQLRLAANPQLGAVVRGGGGIRKYAWELEQEASAGAGA